MEEKQGNINKQEFKCFSCGKVFKDNAHLDRHKKRKTPCLIREVAPEQVNNPNRCIFCNKIFTNVGNRNKHLKTCKVKNGGMEILADKVRYEQEIRILKEQMVQQTKEIEQDKKEKDEQIKKLIEEMDALKKAVLVPNAQNTTNNTQNTQIVNNYNAPVYNITINSYEKPSIEDLKITLEDIASTDKISKLLLQKMYFNPKLPQNHCMYLVNKKDKSLLLYDSNWRIVTGGNSDEVFAKLGNAIIENGTNLINGKDGPYEGKDNKFLELPGAHQQKIIGFNKYEDQLCTDDAYEIFLANRSTVIDTIKAAGCKLI
ncbi:hypothetical protein PV-S19_0259 [Pacmanvirus S19]|nr:hypothetical protein PV-S19_0259 [Pacmanvirus S19]